jgi:hypothetical protein
VQMRGLKIRHFNLQQLDQFAHVSVLFATPPIVTFPETFHSTTARFPVSFTRFTQATTSSLNHSHSDVLVVFGMFTET